MPIYSQEDKILLAIEAIQLTRAAGQKLSVRRAAKNYGVPESSLRDRMNNRPRRETTQPQRHKLDAIEEKTLLQYVIEQDSRGFPLRLAGVEDMANLLLRARNGEPVGKRWARRFVDSQPALKTKFNRPYDYQRALQEDPEVISEWFALLRNMMAKYGIQEGDLYNFDETGFMMGMITASMVVTRADRRGKAKPVQPGNREWATVIECINSGGWCIPPFVIVKGVYHLASWTTESGFPGNWVIKPTANGWTDNQTGLDWIKHFDKHTKNRTKGVYRMLIIDGHESHLSAEFDDYCKQNNIITVSMPAHSSHLLQPLDIALYSPLKRAYGDEINLFIRASINHITKSEFFIAFHQAHNKVFNEENIRSAFQGAGISPWDPDHVIKKLDVHLRTPTPLIANPSTPPPWQSQTPSNPQQTVSQSSFIKIEQLSKGAQAMAQSITILTDRLRTLEDANVALAKRRRAKRTRVQLGGALSIEESQVLCYGQLSDSRVC
ncbi:Pogo transposable element with ZNF domain [Colletotrichum fructicola Nara gc5]|uniref:Pogo transposable element with ZNF domain n=2 Tax=Colletotrichum gloeosporioides species complex TaxID=2707338 RepID=A0A7J6JK00_COLFN|nr:Pogo transposable element with ZNF domain [Colletotrichum fructicola Nara gc5]